MQSAGSIATASEVHRSSGPQKARPIRMTIQYHKTNFTTIRNRLPSTKKGRLMQAA